MRKIALIGTAGSSNKAPVDDESWEIWGVSSRGKHITRATRWFELHRLEGETKEFRDEWRKHVGAFIGDVPLYMIWPEQDLAKDVRLFPVEFLTQRFGTYFLTSSFAWMMAMAIEELRPMNGEPVEGRIGVWGVDMEYASEYEEQRAGFRHFIDLARFAGIPVTRLVTGGLSFEPIPYPMWQDDPLLQKVEDRTQISQHNLGELEGLIKQTSEAVLQNQFAQKKLTEFGNKDAPQEIARLDEERAKLVHEWKDLLHGKTHWEAILEEQVWLKNYLRP